MKNNTVGEEILFGLVLSGYFTIDESGCVWNSKGMRVEHRTPQGYLQVRAMVNGVRYQTGAHRLVWRKFNGPIPEGMIINHKNGLKDDNYPNNLALSTYSDNSSHAHKEGLSDQYGQKNPAVKLTDREVAQIRLAYSDGRHTMKELGKRFGVSFKTISKIVKGQRRNKQGGPIKSCDLRHSVCDRDQVTGRFVGKKKAGRILDGRTWDEFPHTEH